MITENGHMDAGAKGEVYPEHYDAVYDHYKAAFEGLDHIVLSDLEPDGQPINLHLVSPPDVPFRVLLTEGMSAVAMPAPAPGKRFLELSILIPSEIHFPAEGLIEDHPHRWIVLMMRYLARFPAMIGVFLDNGHLVHADSPEGETFGPGCAFGGAILLKSQTLWDSLTFFSGPKGDIRILSVLPLYTSEIDFRVKHGLDALMDRVVSAGINELLDTNRPNLCPPEEEEA